MPFSEISSPSQSKTIVPAIIMEILVNLSKKEICPRIPCPCNIVIKPNPCRETERDGQKPGVLIEFLPAGFAFFLVQLFKFGKNHSEKLHYD